MGEICNTLTFSEKPPDRENVRAKLLQVTGIDVQIHEHLEDSHTVNWSVQFSSPSDRCDAGVEVSIVRPSACVRNQIWVTEGKRRLSWDNLNRCPGYFFFATVAALQNLGCQREEKGDLPAYARESFANWKELNGGLAPPWWKRVCGCILGSFSFVLVGGMFAAFIGLIRLLDFLFWVA